MDCADVCRASGCATRRFVQGPAGQEQREHAGWHPSCGSAVAPPLFAQRDAGYVTVAGSKTGGFFTLASGHVGGNYFAVAQSIAITPGSCAVRPRRRLVWPTI